MKATGIIRKPDDLGRIVIPMEIRKNMAIGECDPLEVFTQDGLIILKPVEISSPYCPYCGGREKDAAGEETSTSPGGVKPDGKLVASS